MMLSRLDSAGLVGRRRARLAAELDAARTPGAAAAQLQRAVAACVSVSSVGGVAGAAAAQRDAIAAQRVERGQARRHAVEVEVGLAVEPPAAFDRLDRASPGDSRRSVPPSCSVFHGVPRPPSQALGHWPTQPGARHAAWRAMRPRPGRICSVVVPFRQQSWRARQVDAVPARRRASTRGGRAGGRVAAVGAAGEHGDGAARPDRAARVGQQQALAGRRRDRAGEPGRRREQRPAPTSTPTIAPAIAQRTAAPRARSHACSASVDSLQPLPARPSATRAARLRLRAPITRRPREHDRDRAAVAGSGLARSCASTGRARAALRASASQSRRASPARR